MVRTAPVLGVGIGQYFARSPEFMSSRMRDWYDAQNAHNQFLQVAGELGLAGLAVFLVLLALALAPAARAIWRRSARPEFVPVVVGVGVFLIASLTMHPLLVPEVSVTFWLLLGVARAAAPMPPAPPWLDRAVAVWIVLAALSIPLRVWY
jgi:O-antigen ligase